MQFTILFLFIWVGGISGDSDFDALVEFRKGIQEDPSGRIIDSWNPSSELDSFGCPINWQQFSGKVDEVFAELQGLVHIDFSRNQFSGSLKSISDDSAITSSLRYLNVSHNESISGSLPEALFRETSMVLTELDLSCNQLTGPIKRITSITLKSLNLSFNNLSGSLPITVGSCAVIDLSNNMLSGNLSVIRAWGNYVEVIDLSSNGLTGILPNETSQFLRLASFNVSNNLLTGELPPVIGTYPELSAIDLSLNQLYGPLPSTLLHHNELDGTIPSGFTDGLIGFNVSYNNLSGNVPNNLLKFPYSSFHPGNELLIFPSSPPSNVSDLPYKGRKHDRQMKHTLQYVLIGCAFACFVLIIVLVIIHRRISGQKRRGSATDKTNSTITRCVEGQKSIEPPPAANQDQYEQGDVSLPPKTDTGSRQQKPSCLIGQQSFTRIHGGRTFSGPRRNYRSSCHGTSYKATLENGHVLIVKWLKEGLAKSKKEFGREVKKLGNIKHQNLVSLRGYYWGPREHERILISDYIDAVSLTTYLCNFRERNLSPLSLPQRLNIAIDIARCLNYLHNEMAIPHGNLKSSNILIQNVPFQTHS
uniref:Protein kinase domain-containing protein n=1 Tax=Ananas comosus var. bracteatus TaxID=296719 RepID=A0A6V7PQS0_ANACO|nr:unnamed protein product [Ananas comosus var. bracteatus]